MNPIASLETWCVQQRKAADQPIKQLMIETILLELVGYAHLKLRASYRQPTADQPWHEWIPRDLKLLPQTVTEHLRTNDSGRDWRETTSELIDIAQYYANQAGNTAHTMWEAAEERTHGQP